MTFFSWPRESPFPKQLVHPWARGRGRSFFFLVKICHCCSLHSVYFLLTLYKKVAQFMYWAMWKGRVKTPISNYSNKNLLIDHYLPNKYLFCSTSWVLSCQRYRGGWGPFPPQLLTVYWRTWINQRTWRWECSCLYLGCVVGRRQGCRLCCALHKGAKPGDRNPAQGPWCNTTYTQGRVAFYANTQRK